MRQIPFAISENKARSRRLSSESVLNMYAHPVSNGKYPYALYLRDGLVLHETLGAGPIRGHLEVNGVRYVVSGSEVYRNGTLLTGASIAGSGPVSMTTNETFVVIVGGGNGYVVTTTVAQITDPDFKSATTVVYMKGVFVFNEEGTGRMFSSAIEDPTNIDALDFATAENAPDDIVGVYREGDRLVVAGKKTIEFWYADGGPQFPFSPIVGATVNTGFSSPYAFVNADNTFFFLGDDLSLYRMGEVPTRVSSAEMERVVRTATNTAVASMFTYARDSHVFVGLLLNNSTWIYDILTRKSFRWSTYGFDTWNVQTGLQVDATVYFGDVSNGNIYTISDAQYTDNGTIIRNVIIPPTVFGQDEFLTITNLRLDMDVGVGLTNGQGSDPLLQFRYSLDGGISWSSELRTTVGKIGEYGTIAQFNDLGTNNAINGFTFEFSMTDPVKRNFLKAWIDG